MKSTNPFKVALPAAMWLLLILSIARVNGQRATSIVGNSLVHARPCEDNSNILISYEPNRPPGEENQYQLNLGEEMGVHYNVIMTFDSDATVTLADSSVARIWPDSDGYFRIRFFKPAPTLGVTIKGPESGTIPYVTSIKLNNEEICKEPKIGFFDAFIQGYKDTAEISSPLPSDSCGRRKVVHTELIVNGQPTAPGDWPFHVALFKVEGKYFKYICGGTLLSKTLILTAAHCASIQGAPVLPESLNVVLGKHNLIGGDIAPQEREVFQVIIHPRYNAKNLNNDIALLKLKSEVVFDDYVQPACLWDTNSYKKLPGGEVFGTVAGWGLDNKDELSTTLQQVTLPKISEATCLKSNPVFFQKTLNSYKFCAGYTNGTSVCNGDSGGGFLIFVPDVAGDSTHKSGTWHVHGIVSMTLRRNDAPICDPNQYALFTDVAKYRDWVMGYLKE
ncbi:chymotrypsin-like elastase family member 2A [Anticarsia gemmatalis]|uniref:chymotrypsin-like elastase family member 2A n=1 Tax=Anticarsia gemmatalis TaxID=129554 RepID=UPI003F76A651